MTVAIYVRKSRPDHPKDTEEETLQRQKEILLDYAAQKNWVVGGIYEEVVSGESLAARPQILKLLEDIKSGVYDAVLCKDIDRLSRGNFEDVGYVHSTLKRHHTLIVTMRKTIDLNDETDEEISDFESIIAKYELRNIVHRLQDGVMKSLHDGNYLANAPYGYRKKMDGRRPTLSIQQEEAEFVKMIFRLYVQEGMGCQSIADTVSTLGAKPRRSERFSRTSIRKILRNPVYTGKTAWNQTRITEKGSRQNPKGRVVSNPRSHWKVVNGKHPAIIDSDTFDRAQQILSGRGHPPYGAGSMENPLAGLVKCRICGKTMQRRPGREKESAQLICPTRNCVRSSALALVEAAVLSQLRALYSGFRLKAEPVPNQTGQSQLLRDRNSIEKRLAVTRRQLDRLSDLVEQGIYPPSKYRERVEILNRRLNELERAKLEICKKVNVSEQKKKDLKPPATIYELYRDLPPDGQNRLLKALIDRIEYYKAKDWKPNQFEILIHWKDIL